MLTLKRNPLLRVALNLWWAPALLILLAVTAMAGQALSLPLLAAGVALVLGVAAPPWLEGRRVERREAEQRRQSGVRFLCPACLRFDGFRCACPECGQELDAWMVWTSGAYVDTCRHCAARIQPEALAGLEALCGFCQARVPGDVYHHRQVELRGALMQGDFASLCEMVGLPPRQSRGISFISLDNGNCLTYALCLEDLSRVEAALPPEHAARSIREVWTHHGDALELVNGVDRFAARAGLDAAQVSTIVLSTDAPAWEVAAERALRARVGTTRTGVPIAEFVSQSRAAAATEQRS